MYNYRSTLYNVSISNYSKNAESTLCKSFNKAIHHSFTTCISLVLNL